MWKHNTAMRRRLSLWRDRSVNTGVVMWLAVLMVVKSPGAGSIWDLGIKTMKNPLNFRQWVFMFSDQRLHDSDEIYEATKTSALNMWEWQQWGWQNADIMGMQMGYKWDPMSSCRRYSPFFWGCKSWLTLSPKWMVPYGEKNNKIEQQKSGKNIIKHVERRLELAGNGRLFQCHGVEALHGVVCWWHPGL